MEADHHQAPARLQHRQAGLQRLLQLVQFGVDEDAKRLKSACGRVLAGLAGAYHARHQLRQLRRGGQWAALLAARHDGLGNRAGKALFAVVTDHLRNLPDLGIGQPLGDAFAARGVHAHVQRPVKAKTETALGAVDLRRAHAQVQQHPSSAAVRQFTQVAKAFMPDRKTRIGNARCFGNRLWVFVKGQQASLRWQSGENAPRVPATPKRGVDPGALRRRIGPAQQGVDRLCQQDRCMGCFWFCHKRLQKEKSWKTSGRVPCMAFASCAS